MIKIRFIKPYRGILADGLAKAHQEVSIDPASFEGLDFVKAQADFYAALDCGVFDVVSGEWPIEPEPNDE